jgi:hypothetical protein
VAVDRRQPQIVNRLSVESCFQNRRVADYGLVGDGRHPHGRTAS